LNSSLAPSAEELSRAIKSNEISLFFSQFLNTIYSLPLRPAANVLHAFCKLQNKMEYYFWLHDEQWTTYLSYLCDIFEQNKLNLEIQGRNSNVIKFVDALKAFKAKSQNWKSKIENCTMFEKLDVILDSRGNKMPEKIRKDISKHLSALQNEFERYFPKTSNKDLDF